MHPDTRWGSRSNPSSNLGSSAAQQHDLERCGERLDCSRPYTHMIHGMLFNLPISYIPADGDEE